VTRFRGPRSLGRQVFLALVVGELAFAAAIGITIGVFTTLSGVRQRETAVREISSAIGAGLMPMIADQQITHVQAQLSSILQTAELHDLVGIRITDASGTEIASQGTTDEGARRVERGSSTPLSALFEQQLVNQPIVVDGLQVATVSVWFSPQGLVALRIPAIASLLVLLSVILVSLPWTAWKLSVEVVEPIDELGTFATRIAEGDFNASPPHRGVGEIGELQRTLARMSRQLKDRDDRLKTSYSELSQAYDDLGDAKTELEWLSARKADFVAVAAHEIRGPLATIALYAELLESGVFSELETDSLEAAEAISSASSRLGSIVSDLMDSALLERGLMPIEFDQVWLGELVAGAVKDAQMMAQSRDIEIRLEDQTSDAAVRGDALRLRQVLDNLLSNALKYSPSKTQVTVRMTEDADFVEIVVADQGRGVPEAGQHVLFTLFGRVDSADGRDTEGLGLGLAISSRIVHAHGGRLTFRENEMGKGSAFCVVLPWDGPGAGLSSTTIAMVGEDENE